MQITHEEARRLIQFNADESLNSVEKTSLYTHLDHCLECHAYAEEIRNVERTLIPLMKRQWSLQPGPLLINSLLMRRNGIVPARSVLTIRKIAISLVFALFVFGLWQFTLLDGRGGSPLSGGMPPVPTPSIASTSTRMILENCDMMIYTIQQNDTLASIADRFSISKEEIISLNGLKTETANTGMELTIPICNFTPTSTIDPAAALTTTFTPVTNPSISPAGPNG
jgi:LysM domain-containing protein